MATTTDAPTPRAPEDARSASLAWLWALVAVSVVLILMLNVLALIPVGVVLLAAGLIRRLTATDPHNRAAGTGLAVAGLALAGITTVLLLTLVPVTQSDAEADGVIEDIMPADG